MSPVDPTFHNPCVGRERELALFEADLRAAESGDGRLVLIKGVPGVGKTRLCEEFLDRAAGRGIRSLVGRCDEREGAPPYWPWIQLLRAHASDTPALVLRRQLGTAAIDVAELVPEIRARLPRLGTMPSLEPAEARFRLFEGLAGFLRRIAADTPLVVILDDLHWADPSSLRILDCLARGLRGSRLVVVGTYRDIALETSHPLVEVLGELARQPGLRRVDLTGFGPEDVRSYVETLTGRSIAPEVAGAVHAQTDGLPFFVAELVRLLLAEGRLDGPPRFDAPIPESVRDAIGRRLAHLSEPTRKLLQVAAVAGREFEVSIVAKAGEDIQAGTGTDAPRMLEEAVAMRMIQPGSSPRRYRFYHALIREVVCDMLPSAWRRELHLRVATAIEDEADTDDGDVQAQLAHHFFEGSRDAASRSDAASAAKAVHYAEKAAQRAERTFAYAEAAALYEKALEAQLQGGGIDERRRCALLLRRAEALDNAGERAPAREICRGVIATSRRIGAADLQASAAIGLAGWLALTYRVEGTVAPILEEARLGLAGLDSRLHACVLARLSIELGWLGAEGFLDLAEQAVAMARRLQDPTAFLWALHALHSVVSDCSRIPELLALADDSVALGASLAEPALALMGHRWRIYDLLVLGDVRAARVEVVRYGSLAAERQIPFHLWSVQVYENVLALLSGRFAVVEEGAARALATGERVQHLIGHAAYTAQTHVLWRELGRYPEGLPVAMDRFVEENPHHYSARCLLSVMYLDVGRRDDARRVFEFLALTDFAPVFESIDWLVCSAYLAEACVRLDDTERAQLLYRRLQPAWGYAVIANPSVVYGSVSYFLGLLASTMKRWDTAVEHLEEALAAHRRMEASPLVAHTQLALSRALAMRGEANDAERVDGLRTRARAAALALGMQSLAQAVDAESGRPSESPQASLLEGAPLAVILVDGDGRVLASNRDARSILDERDGLVVAAGVLRSMDLVADELLRTMIARTLRERTTGEFLAVLRSGNRRPLGLLVAPADPRLFADSPGGIAIFVSDPERSLPPLGGALRGIYGLTPAETRLAVLLAAGARVEAAARQLGISPHTARTQLRRIFAKTDTHRQADLVRLLLEASAISRLDGERS